MAADIRTLRKFAEGDSDGSLLQWPVVHHPLPGHLATLEDGKYFHLEIEAARGTLQFMVLVTSNKAKQLLCVSYIERVRRGDLERSRQDLEALIAELGPGFRLLTDLSRLEAMDLDCATELGDFMEFIDRSGVSLVVRVIPDPKKDIGLNILTVFHYRHHPKFVSCAKMSQAAKHLSL